ncbi:MAG TPA: sigma-E factor regulatory protein RseB domain-containing protein [Motilibacteraceae bacterium]|nr:sigma-E factor regulatory protein RseB domain-containing protein [Motilibacteraceae bacterium]
MTQHRSGGPRLLLLTLLLGLLGAVAVSGALLLLPADEVPVEEEPPAGQAAGRPVTVEPRGVADPRAVELLRRAAGAAGATSFTGTQMVSTWDREGAASYLLDVDNEPGAGLSVRVHSSATNPQGAGYTTVSGADNVASVGGSATGEELRLLLDSYDLSVERSDRVAGRATTVVSAGRPGGGVAARFWIDDASGLVLRREVYDAGGRMVRAAAFVDVDVDVAHFVKHPPPLLPGRSGRELSGAELAAWDERGWACPKTLPAGLRLVDARSTTAGAAGGQQGSSAQQPILHLTYSDGLSAVSVFQQRGELDPAGLAGYRPERWAGGREVLVSDGFPRRVLWSARGLVFTVVGDAADDAVDAAVAALPHETASRTGVRERLRRGVERLGSWLDPFH